ncbi:MarR family winged helix-turn-helix transcriptional regulator [Solimicrobium silvestre]|uniref:Transcriptional regulator n=1 Tax=Solimicrobium silvestre TaxID=2099400 RepID=A0A2S9H4R8_9BURK|nr:MarR family transcriptional regulator [Solimicrobium silvestre]PRC94933.1 Transcriptional regulator [Solimicrobium silvestre]
MSQKNIETAAIDFTQAVGLLVRRLRAVAATQGLSMTESVVMARLEKEGPATIADLARAEGMKPQSMGTTVAALEEMDLIVRKAHPTDGRQMLIELSDNGLALRKSTGDAKRTWLTQAIAQLDETERETLYQASDIIRRLVEK